MLVVAKQLIQFCFMKKRTFNNRISLSKHSIYSRNARQLISRSSSIKFSQVISAPWMCAVKDLAIRRLASMLSQNKIKSQQMQQLLAATVTKYLLDQHQLQIKTKEIEILLVLLANQSEEQGHQALSKLIRKNFQSISSSVIETYLLITFNNKYKQTKIAQSPVHQPASQNKVDKPRKITRVGSLRRRATQFIRPSGLQEL